MPDWTCICVGLNNGEVRFLDQYGQAIFRQQFHVGSAVQRIAAWSHLESQSSESTATSSSTTATSSSTTSGRELVFVLSDRHCAQLDGAYLFESLNGLKKRLAHSQAGHSNLSDGSASLLSFKQWSMDTHETVVDVAFGGLGVDTVLDSVYYFSTLKGPFVTPSEAASKFINCAVVGKSPFLGFYKLPLESESMDMGDLAHAVYSKVKGAIFSSVSSWLTGSQPTQPQKSQSTADNSGGTGGTETVASGRLQSVYNVDEPSRRAAMVAESGGRLAAMTDDYGRIFLLDLADTVILRAWKGYRDAQVSILTASGSTNSGGRRRHVHYLAIYAPRRGLIEVWTLPFGGRVASFDVGDRHGRLLHVPPNTELGLTKSLSLGSQQQHGQRDTVSTLFLDSAGILSKFEVPFHLSLAATSSTRSQDSLVLKHFKVNFLKAGVRIEGIQQEFCSVVRLLKLASSVEYLISALTNIDSLAASSYLGFCKDTIRALHNKEAASASTDEERDGLINSLTNKALIVEFYEEVICIGGPGDHQDQEQLTEASATDFNLEQEDYDRLKEIVRLYDDSHIRVAESDSPAQETAPAGFLGLLTGLQVLETDGTTHILCLAKQISTHDLQTISTLLFKDCISGRSSVEEVVALLSKSRWRLELMSCFRLLLAYVLLTAVPVTRLWTETAHLKSLMLALLLAPPAQNDLGVGSSILQSASTLQAWTQLVYEQLDRSSRLASCLVVASLVRVLLFELGRFLEQDDDEEADQWGDRHEWETMEVCDVLEESLGAWNDTCQRLEDLSVFSTLVNSAPLAEDVGGSSKQVQQHAVFIGGGRKTKLGSDRDLTLGLAVDCGKGIFSERFAKWAVRWGLKFGHLNELYKSLGSTLTFAEEPTYPVPSSTLLNMKVKEIFCFLYKQLPHSLEYESVLINVSWEYARLWAHSIQRLEYLDNSNKLLSNIGPLGGLVVQGVGAMMWELHLSGGLAALFPGMGSSTTPATSATNDVAGQYSTQLCVDVAEIVIQILDTIGKALESMDVVPAFSSDPVWRSSQPGRTVSLVEMAVAKEMVVPPCLLSLQLEVVRVLQLVHLTQMTPQHAHSLYSRESRRAIFGSLTSAPSGVTEVSLAQEQADSRGHRLHFVEQVIDAAVQSQFGVGASGSGDEEAKVRQTLRTLAVDQWGLERDQLRRGFVVAYYRHGLDSQAALFLDKVEDKPALGLQLLPVIGCRVKKEHLQPSCKHVREYSKYLVNQRLVRWLAQLSATTLSGVAMTPLEPSLLLLDQILEWLQDNEEAQELASCLQSLMLQIERTLCVVDSR